MKMIILLCIFEGKPAFINLQFLLYDLFQFNAFKISALSLHFFFFSTKDAVIQTK